MASNRHLGRIVALQTLYEQDFRLDCKDPGFDLSEVLVRNISRYSETIEDQAFIRKLVEGVTKHQSGLDTILQPIAPEWPIDQIARMDRVMLRMGIYELSYEPGVPPKVVINEYVELAKAFGGDNSSKFVNGVLGTVLRAIENPTNTETAKPTPKKQSTKTSTAKKTIKPKKKVT